MAVLPNNWVLSSSYYEIRLWNPNTGEFIRKIEVTEVDVSQMDLSSAILTEDLAKLLWQNGAKISDADYEKHCCPL